MNRDTALQRAAQVRELLADDRLREALELLLQPPEAPALPRNQLLLLQSRLADQERAALRRTDTAETLDVRRNQFRESLLHCADLLEQPDAPSTATPGSASDANPTLGSVSDATPDDRLQKHAFRLLLAGKIVLFLYIAFHFHIHAFSQGETLLLLGLLSPVLIGYLLTATPGPSGRVSSANRGLLRGLVYLGLPLYVLLVLWILRKVPLDEWTFETARNWIIGVEAAFAGLVVYLKR